MIATGLQNFVKRKADSHYASLAPEQRSTHRLMAQQGQAVPRKKRKEI